MTVRSILLASLLGACGPGSGPMKPKEPIQNTGQAGTTQSAPDPDNDRDGIRDIDDQCPNDPEVMNGQTDDDGCPP